MTDKERERMMQHPRVRRLIESGDADEAAKLMSMAYLVMSVAKAYQDDADDILKGHGMIMYNAKRTMNTLEAAFRNYNTVLKSMIPDLEARMQLCRDFDIVRDVLDAFMGNEIEVKRGKYYKASLYLPEKTQ